MAIAGTLSQVGSSTVGAAAATAAAVAATGFSSQLANPQLQAAVNNLMLYVGNGATIIVIPSFQPNQGGSGATPVRAGGSTTYNNPFPASTGPVTRGSSGGSNGSVSASAAAEHKQALKGLQQNYGYFPKDENGYVTRESLELVANDPSAPPEARRAAIYFLDPANQKEMDALDTSREKYQDGVVSYDEKISYEDIVSEQTHPDKVQPRQSPEGLVGATWRGASSEIEAKHQEELVGATWRGASSEIEAKHQEGLVGATWRGAELQDLSPTLTGKFVSEEPAPVAQTPPPVAQTPPPAAQTPPDMPASVKTLAGSVLFADEKAEVSWSTLSTIANGTQSAYPTGSPEQAAAKAIMESPGAKERLCGGGDTFKKGDLLKLAPTAHVADPATGGMSADDKTACNGKSVTDPSFFFKDGTHTTEWDQAMKAAEGNPARQVNLTAALDSTNNSSVKNAATALSTSAALFNGDSKASYADLVKIAAGTPVSPGAPTPTATDIAAATCLVNNYTANGGKGGGSVLDKILRGDADFNTKEMGMFSADGTAAAASTTTMPAPTAAEAKTAADAKTLASSLLFTSDKSNVSWTTLEAIASGKQTAYPTGSPEQLAAKAIFDTPGAKAKLCGAGENFTKGDLLKLSPSAHTADPTTGGISAADKDIYNKKSANDPSFFYKDGTHTPEWDFAMKTSEGDPARQADLIRAIDSTSAAGVKQAMTILSTSKALYNGDGKASYGDLVKISEGKPVRGGAPVPTPEETAAAKSLIENYVANGGKGGTINGGKSKLDLVLGSDADFSDKEFNAQLKA